MSTHNPFENILQPLPNPFASAQPVVSDHEIKSTFLDSISQPEIPTNKTDWHSLTPDLNAVTVDFQIPEGITPEVAELLVEWEKSKAQLSVLKDYEMELRKCVVNDSGLFNADKQKGTEHVMVGDVKYTSVKKLNYNLKQDKKLIDTALASFSEGEAELLIGWTAKLSVTNYEKLPEDKQAAFKDVLEIKPGAPELKITKPENS